MSNSHIPAAELEQFVIDALPPRRGREVEEHLVECTECSARLMREAELEMTLFSVARQVASVAANDVGRGKRRASVLRGLTLSIATTVSLAAAFTLFVARPSVTSATSRGGFEASAEGVPSLEDAATFVADGQSADPLDGGSDVRLAGL